MTNPYGNPGYGPPPQQQQRPPQPQVVRVPRDGSGMAALRVITYILTSLASLLFIVLVVYGYLQLRNIGAALDGLGGGLPSFAPR
ncbi:hypothetical protein [Pseudonocardia sp. GCM10023141]|uniref:hypothetical protein n=1 Tax=Pseudonocardia sp. GCM10023141 TaxID=3252653 RepID=UPI00361C493F